MINYLTRRKYRAIGSGDSDILAMLNDQADPTQAESAEFNLEYRREVFHWAAEQVRRQVKERTWLAFWRTSIEGRAIAEIASELEMTVGAVHIARSRVLGRLREMVLKFELQVGE